MSNDFEPVFRDGIGYCNVACELGHWHCDNGESVWCSYLDNGAVCIPWVRSLLKTPMPDEKVRDAIRWLDMTFHINPTIGAAYRTLIDAYRAEVKVTDGLRDIASQLNPPPKTQAQQDAEWLRDNCTLRPIPTLLEGIIARLKASKE